MRPGISCSARRISLRPHSASLQIGHLVTAAGRLSAAASNACIFSVRTVAIAFLLVSAIRDRDLAIAIASRKSEFINAAILVAHRREQRRAFRVGIGGQRPHPDVVEPGSGEEPRHLLLGKSEPDVAHLLLILLALVRQHVDDEQRGRPAGPRAPLRRARGPDPASSAAPATASRHRARRPRAAALRDRPGGCRRSSARQPAARGVEHVGRAVDGDDAPHVRRNRLGELPRPASQIADDQRRIDQAEHRPQVEAVAEQVAAQAIPVAGGGGEELLRLRAAAREDALQPPLVLAGGGRRRHLLANQRPEPARARIEVVERHAVEAARAVAPGADPIVVRERLQVAADARLRHLQDRAQLRHRQLVLFEQEQNPAAGRVGQRRHVLEDRNHPSIRMDCYICSRSESKGQTWGQT